MKKKHYKVLITLFDKLTFLTPLLFYPLCFLLTPTVFLPLFAGEFQKGRVCNAQDELFISMQIQIRALITSNVFAIIFRFSLNCVYIDSLNPVKLK